MLYKGTCIADIPHEHINTCLQLHSQTLLDSKHNYKWKYTILPK